MNCQVVPAQKIVGTDVRTHGGVLSTEEAGNLLKQMDTANLSEEEAAKIVASMSQKPASRAQQRRDVSYLLSQLVS